MISALRQMHDVEVVMRGHAAWVVGIAQLLDDGRYVLTLSHDRAQGEDGGNTLEVVTFDPGTRMINGTSCGREFLTFIIDRPGP